MRKQEFRKKARSGLGKVGGMGMYKKREERVSPETYNSQVMNLVSRNGTQQRLNLT